MLRHQPPLLPEGGDPRSLRCPKAVPLVSGCCLLCGRLATETHGPGQGDSLQVPDGWALGTLPLHKAEPPWP